MATPVENGKEKLCQKGVRNGLRSSPIRTAASLMFKKHRNGPVFTAFRLCDPSRGIDEHFETLESMRARVQQGGLEARVANWQAWQGNEESHLLPGTCVRPRLRMPTRPEMPFAARKAA